MRKKFLIFVSLLAIVWTFIGAGTKLSATDGFGGNHEQFPDDYNVTSGAIVEASASGGNVHVTNLEHGNMVELSTNVTIDDNNQFLNLKGVLDNIYRIKLFLASETKDDGNNVQVIRDIFTETALDSNGVFELNYLVPSEWYGLTLSKVALQVYIEQGKGSLRLLGAAFDADGTFSDFTEFETTDPGDDEEDVVLGGNAEQIGDDYNVTTGAVIESSAAGGNLYVTNLIHAQMVEIRQINNPLTDDTKYFNLKGVVDNIYRIKLNFASDEVDGGATKTVISRLFDLAPVDENGVFELHYEIPSEWLNVQLKKISMQVYINETETGSLRLLGAAFDADGSYSNFSTIPQENEEEETAIEIAAEWTSENPEVVITDTEVNGFGKVNFGAAFTGDAPARIEIPVLNFKGGAETAYISLKYSLENVAALNLLMYYAEIDETVIRDQWGGISSSLPTNEFDYSIGYLDVAHLMDGFNVTTVDYDKHGFRVSTANISGYISADVVVEKIVLEVICEEDAFIEFMGMEFTADGDHSLEVPAGDLTFGEMQGNDIAEVSKNEEGLYVVSYSTSPGWNTVDITVSNYDGALNIFEVIFTPSSQITMCIQINGITNWEIGHKVYGARRNVEQLDVSSYNLPKNFTVSFYLDASVAVDELKTITFESITFKEPDPEPEGLYLMNPVTSAMACIETAVGYEVSYVNDGSTLWRKVDFGVKNHTSDYDILAISMRAVEGMKLGIRVYWLDSEGVENHMEVRNHWNNQDSIFTSTGDVILVFNFNAFEEISGNQITKVGFYFDPPTSSAPYLVNEGQQVTTIYSLEFLKSSELELEDLEIVAENMTATYNGERIAFEATNAEDLPMKIYYKGQDDDDYTEDAPRNAGVYEVKVVFAGNLTYDHKVVYATLTINKANRTLSEDLVQFDPKTGVITFDDNILVSTSSDFSNLLTSGTVLTEDTTVYINYKQDDNYNDLEPITVELELEEVEDPNGEDPNGEDPNGEDPNGEDPNGEDPDKKPKKKGCFSTITGGSAIMFVIGILGAFVVIIRRRRIA